MNISLLNERYIFMKEEKHYATGKQEILTKFYVETFVEKVY
jgi:hypothetical protein